MCMLWQGRLRRHPWITSIFPALAVTMLNEHRKAQLEVRLQLGMGKPDAEALVFSNHDGTPISPQLLFDYVEPSGGEFGLARCDVP